MTTTDEGHCDLCGTYVTRDELPSRVWRDEGNWQCPKSRTGYHQVAPAEPIEARMIEPGEIIITKTGRVLTDADIEALADEAERGYDVAHLRNRPDRRKS